MSHDSKCFYSLCIFISLIVFFNLGFSLNVFFLWDLSMLMCEAPNPSLLHIISFFKYVCTYLFIFPFFWWYIIRMFPFFFIVTNSAAEIMKERISGINYILKKHCIKNILRKWERQFTVNVFPVYVTNRRLILGMHSNAYKSIGRSKTQLRNGKNYETIYRKAEE